MPRISFWLSQVELIWLPTLTARALEGRDEARYIVELVGDSMKEGVESAPNGEGPRTSSFLRSSLQPRVPGIL